MSTTTAKFYCAACTCSFSVTLHDERPTVPVSYRLGEACPALKGKEIADPSAFDVAEVIEASEISWCPFCGERRLGEPVQGIPSSAAVARALAEIEAEDADEPRRRAEREARERPVVDEINRRCKLPSEDPEHCHGLHCDGEDSNGRCQRLRRKLFGRGC